MPPGIFLWLAASFHYNYSLMLASVTPAFLGPSLSIILTMSYYLLYWAALDPAVPGVVCFPLVIYFLGFLPNM